MKDLPFDERKSVEYLYRIYGKNYTKFFSPYTIKFLLKQIVKDSMKKYDPNKNVSWKTYLHNQGKQFITMMEQEGYMFQIPRSTLKDLRKVQNVINEMGKHIDLIREDDIEHISLKTGLNKKRVKNILDLLKVDVINMENRNIDNDEINTKELLFESYSVPVLDILESYYQEDPIKLKIIKNIRKHKTTNINILSQEMKDINKEELEKHLKEIIETNRLVNQYD
jgi:hypothetical protein